jgi:hypothetical protein
MMSTLFQGRSGGSAKAATGAGTFVDSTGLASRYLTDGVDLYRFIGAVASGMGQMVELENCRSLEVVLLPIGDLRARPLRAVTPAPASGAGTTPKPRPACLGRVAHDSR